MKIQQLHPEDVKAAIRKRYGSLRAFVEHEGLPARGVSDLLRGRPSKRVREAVEKVLQEQSPKSTAVASSSRAA